MRWVSANFCDPTPSAREFPAEGDDFCTALTEEDFVENPYRQLKLLHHTVRIYAS